MKLPSQPSIDARQLRILAVDDDEWVLRCIEALYAGVHLIESVDTLAGAWERLKNDDYDVVILDVRLEDGMGDDLFSDMRSVRELRRSRRAEVILLTATNDPRVKERARLLDAVAFLSKPIDERKLTAALAQAAQRIAGR